MATADAYRLQPRSPFHFGERGVGLEETAEIFRSDSLFSALCSVVREGWGSRTLEGLLEAFWEPAGPPFLLSSCFPYAGEVLFFPRPMLAPAVEHEPETAKRLKGTRYVSHQLLGRWLSGEDLAADARVGNFLVESKAWISAAELATLSGLIPTGTHSEPGRGALWWKAEVPRVTIDRQTSSSAVYRCGRLAFRDRCGLYFLVDWRDEGFRSLFAQALSMLGDAGIGGRRSTGYGQFHPLPPEPVVLPEPTGSDAVLTVSLYWPSEDEIAAGVLSEGARYDLVSRYGWLSSPEGRAVRRREVRMVAEGSVLRTAKRTVGALVDVTPEGFTAHRVYRYGFAFPLPVRLTGSDG